MVRRSNRGGVDMNVGDLILKLSIYSYDHIVEMYDGGIAIHNVRNHDDVIDHIKEET